jgi:hypothetical protein
MFVLCVLYSKDKRQSQDTEDKEIRIKYRERQRKTKNPVGGEIFHTRADRHLGCTQSPIQWVPGLFPHLAPRLKKQWRYTIFWAFMPCSRAKVYV